MKSSSPLKVRIKCPISKSEKYINIGYFLSMIVSSVIGGASLKGGWISFQGWVETFGSKNEVR